MLRSNRNHTQWAARAPNNLERRGNHDGTGRRQQLQVDQAGDAKFACAVHEGVIWERRVEATRLARIRADGLHANAEHIALSCQELRAGLVKARRMRPVGLHVQAPEDALRRAAEGWQFIAVGSELRMMMSSAQDVVKKLRPQGETKDVARY